MSGWRYVLARSVVQGPFSGLLDFASQIAYQAQQRRDPPAVTYRLRAVPAVLPGIPVPLWRSRRRAAVHPTSPVGHRW